MADPFLVPLVSYNLLVVWIGVMMMPLTMVETGEIKSVKKIGGKEETRQFLAKLGFVPGSRVAVVTAISGNVIVSVKESRVAISREMAGKIMV